MIIIKRLFFYLTRPLTIITIWLCKLKTLTWRFKMDKSRPDVIQLLNFEKEYHMEQIHRINVAIAALRGETNKSEPETTQKKKKRLIKWAAEIKKIFDSGLELNLKELRDMLMEKGISEVMGKSGKNAVYSTVSRLKSDKYKYLEQIENGKYRKKQRFVRKDLNFNIGETQ